jgi:16S rRNA (uracil1498-N3)-methyltransferase
MPADHGPDPVLVASAAHVFVDDLDAPVADSDDAHHLARVLRLRTGELVTAGDGRGRWRLCTFVAADRLEPAGEIVTDPATLAPVTVGFGIPKGDRPEWIVQKLTEIGADRIVPLHTDRGVVRWDAARAAKHLTRLRRIAREAASQSRRTWLPVVDDVVDAASLLGEPGCALATMGGGSLTEATSMVLVGPEGGWSQRELTGSATTVGLGSTVLRVDTAALVACTYLVQRRAC